MKERDIPSSFFLRNSSSSFFFFAFALLLVGVADFYKQKKTNQ
jgi:hypothetical protein